MENEKIYLCLLHKIWINHNKLQEIFKTNKNYKDFFDKITKQTLKNNNFNENQIINILKNIKNIKIEKINEILIKNEIKIITNYENDYPSELYNIFNPPYFIYLKGQIYKDNKIAIVWTREITEYWVKVTKNITKDLVNNFTIVSWWASWCDSIAHISAFENNWKTIAIIWTWIDICYPKTNKLLYENIIKNNWAIISIFPLWEQANRYNFPIRNEIIAWLSKWVIVIEAKEKSWSLITAKLSLDLWKNIYAIPWNIYSNYSAWTNKIIKNSEAKLVMNINDILEDYDFKNIIKNKEISYKDETEKQIHKLIQKQSLNINEISKIINLDILKTSIYLSEMEIKWLICKQDWKYIA